MEIAPDSNPPSDPLTQLCVACDAAIDIEDQDPLDLVSCPHCGAEVKVFSKVRHFDLMDVAGRGGMGVVYKAADTSLHRDVALKLLRKDHSKQSDFIKQLETEAAITASINHPHVVKVFSTGYDRGRFYIAMEMVSKGSLDDLIRIQGSVAELQALQVGVHIAKGLRAAHERGLIHRDVKPGNVLFSDAHTAKIVDFGLAIFMEDEESVRGEIWGTPYYVAPEKLDKKPEDFRSDIYSLGATLFHALAGRPPFEAETPSLVALKHLKSQPVSLQAFAPHVSGNTAYVINRTLLKDPSLRYQSYDDLIEHLEYALEQLEATAGRSGPQQKRVVLENAVQQKAMGWITLLTIAVIGFSAVAVLSLKNRAGLSLPGSGIKNDESIEKELGNLSNDGQRALQKLLEGEPEEAAREFHAIRTRGPLPETELKWAMVQEGLAELDAGRISDAQSIFRAMATRPRRPKATDDEKKLDTFFAELGSALASDEPVSPQNFNDVKMNQPEAFALLLYAMKNWHLDRLEDAATMFRQFRSIRPTSKYLWFSKLVPVASRYLDELSTFQMGIQKVKAAPTPEAKARAAAELIKFDGPLGERLKKELPEDVLLRARTIVPPIRTGGVYRIFNKKTNQALSVSEISTANGVRVQATHSKGGIHQLWRAADLGQGLFQFMAPQGRKALIAKEEASAEDKAQGVGVLAEAGKNQKWKVEGMNGGFYRITRLGSDNSLTVRDNEVDQPSPDTSSVIEAPFTGAPEQLWSFMPAQSLWINGQGKASGQFPVSGTQSGIPRRDPSP
jgi:serine/threonine protein kinase